MTAPTTPDEIVVRNAEGDPLVTVMRACEGVIVVCPARGDRNQQLDSVFTVRDAQAVPFAHALLRVAELERRLAELDGAAEGDGGE